jgi:hypothetical protein
MPPGSLFHNPPSSSSTLSFGRNRHFHYNIIIIIVVVIIIAQFNDIFGWWLSIAACGGRSIASAFGNRNFVGLWRWCGFTTLTTMATALALFGQQMNGKDPKSSQPQRGQGSSSRFEFSSQMKDALTVSRQWTKRIRLSNGVLEIVQGSRHLHFKLK